MAVRCLASMARADRHGIRSGSRRPRCCPVGGLTDLPVRHHVHPVLGEKSCSAAPAHQRVARDRRSVRALVFGGAHRLSEHQRSVESRALFPYRALRVTACVTIAIDATSPSSTSSGGSPSGPRGQHRLRNRWSSGDFIVLTPGGRYSKDIAGLRPLTAMPSPARAATGCCCGIGQLREVRCSAVRRVRVAYAGGGPGSN